MEVIITAVEMKPGDIVRFSLESDEGRLKIDKVEHVEGSRWIKYWLTSEGRSRFMYCEKKLLLVHRPWPGGETEDQAYVKLREKAAFFAKRGMGWMPLLDALLAYKLHEPPERNGQYD